VILGDPHVTHAHLRQTEAKAAELTAKWIDIDDTEQHLPNTVRGDAPDKLPSTVRTFHLRHQITFRHLS
jgi:hypothetical protein